MSQTRTLNIRRKGGDDHLEPASENTAKAADEAKAAKESSEEAVSTPGGFRNDPDDPTNPNEVIERHRRQLRP